MERTMHEESHAEIIRAAVNYVEQRGWAVLGAGGRCHDCHADINEDDHGPGCDYDRLRQAVHTSYRSKR
jgi:hypothetical protein